MAPTPILEYVAAHECVHLIHMNHSAAFWRKVSELGVDARGAARWFKANGQKLFSFGAQKPQSESDDRRCVIAHKL